MAERVAIKCSSTEATSLWQQHMDDLDDWMVKKSTHPDLVVAISQALKAWHTSSPTPAVVSSWTGVTKALLDQDNLGWHKLFDGIVANLWIEVQDRYYIWLRKRNIGRRWLSAFVSKLWTIAWDMWKHRMKVLEEGSSYTQMLQNLQLDE